MMKRFISLLLSILLVATMAVPAFAESTGGMTVTLTRSEPERTVFKKNEIFTVTVSVACNNDAIKSGRVLADFPDDTLELTNVACSNYIKLIDNITANGNKNTKDAIFAVENAQKFEGEICTFTFKVLKGSASSSTVSFDVKYLDGTTVDESGTAVPVATATETLSVSTSCGTAHNYGTEIAEVPARCGVAGTKAHRICADCGQIEYKNTDGQFVPKESDNDLVITPLEHSWSQNYVSNDSEGHYYKCTREGCTAIISAKENGTVGQKVGHSYSGNKYAPYGDGHARKCDICGYIDESTIADHETGHYRGGTGGHQEYCPVCDHVYDEELLDHNFTVLVTKDNAGSLSFGSGGYRITDDAGHVYKCQDCPWVSEKTAHTFVCVAGTGKGEGGNGIEVGKHAQKCSVCDYITEAENHTSSTWIKDAENGQHYKVCDSCKTEFDRENHIWETKNNETNHWQECSICGEKKEVTAHNYSTFVTKDEETHTYKCSCGKEKTENHNHAGNGGNYKSDDTGHWYVCRCGYEKLGFEPHTFDEPDCTKDGTCTKCGCVRHAGDHSWGTPEQTKAPTCTTVGTNKYTCTSCGATETDDIPALGHNYGNPTYSWNNDQCTATRTCTRRGCTDTQANHTISKTETGTYVKDTDATCIAAEKGHYEVTFDDNQFGSAQTDENTATSGNPLGHDTEHTNAVAATCTEPGTKEYWRCKRCNNYYSDEDCTTLIGGDQALTSWKAVGGAGYIAPLGHIVSSDSKAATCTEAGYKTYYTCTRDGCTCKDNYYTDSALTVSIGDGTLDTWKGPTGDGYIAALGHKYELTGSTAATCETPGAKNYKCERCGVTKEDTIPAHHTYGADGVCTVCHEGLDPEKVKQLQETVGKIKVEQKKDESTGKEAANVNTPVTDILNAVAGNNGLPADIVKQIADGAALTVTFEVKKKNENDAKVDVSVAESSADEVKSESKGGEVKAFDPIEIDLSMVLKAQGGGTIGEGEIHNLSEPIEIAVPVPADIQVQTSGKVVEYFMLRIHGTGDNKEVKVLKAWIDNGKYCFETDKLSTFVPMIVISDPEPEERPHSHGDTIVIGKRDNKEETKEVEENPNTGAPVPSFGIALVVLGAASIAVSKKRK